MEFLRLLSFSVVLTSLFAGLRSLEVAIQESDGAADDGVVEAGGTFSVYCSVPEIRAGNVVVWFKRQEENQPSVLAFNDFILDPTAQAKFEGVSVTQEADEDGAGGGVFAYILNLKEDVGADFTDSGEYGCVLTSRIPTTDTDHEALDIQYAQLTVIDPVDEMRLFSVRADQVNDPLANYETHVDGDSVIVSNDEERYFRCVARGANPPAAVTVTYNDNDITDQYKEDVQKNYVETEGAASNGQHITYDVIKTSTHPTRISREDNQKLLVCSAEVPDREPEQIAIELRVEGFPPRVQCQDTLAAYQQKVAQLVCHVESDSPLDIAEFVYHEKTKEGYVNHTIRVGERNGPMTVRKVPGKYDGEWMYALEFEYAPEQSFRSYTFRASNSVSKGEFVSSTAALHMENPGAVKAGASVQRATVLGTLLSAAAAATFFWQ